MDTLVLGIGNLLWADEGFGVRAVEALNDGWRFPEYVTLMDGGTQGLYLLPHVQSARQVLVFDAIDYGLEPGTLQVVRDDDIPSYLGVGKMSLHQTCFQEVLELARFSGKSPERAVLVGVQPKVLKDFGGSLTEIVRAKLPEALAIGLQALADWGVRGHAARARRGGAALRPQPRRRALRGRAPDRGRGVPRRRRALPRHPRRPGALSHVRRRPHAGRGIPRRGLRAGARAARAASSSTCRSWDRSRRAPGCSRSWAPPAR